MRCVVAIPTHNEALTVPSRLADAYEAVIQVENTWRAERRGPPVAELFGRVGERVTATTPDTTPDTTVAAWTAGDRR